jgi:aldose sugar dehydrogenase
MPKRLLPLASIIILAACSTAPAESAPGDDNVDASGAHPDVMLADAPFDVAAVAAFDEPWAMTFIPGTPYALITEKAGKLKLWQADGSVKTVAGVPKVDYGGQGGLGDVVLSPVFAKTEWVYLSWVEAGPNATHGAVVGRALLTDMAGSPRLTGMEIIWRQTPKVTGRGHFGHRIAFSPDGQYLFISSGERQKFDPAQDMSGNLGKIVRLNPDGSIPADNPFAAAGGVSAQIWSLGHRNPLGLTFDARGRLWNSEMGPEGGDELNLVTRGANHGYPKASNGSHYGGKDIPDHAPGDGFIAPQLWWNPSVSPAGLMAYSGKMFPAWKDSLFMGALGGEALIRIDVHGEVAHKAERWAMSARIREVEEGPDGAIWLLTDGSGGQLLKLTPKSGASTTGASKTGASKP